MSTHFVDPGCRHDLYMSHHENFNYIDNPNLFEVLYCSDRE